MQSSCVSEGGLEGGRCFAPYAGWQRPAFDGRQAFPWALSGNCRAIWPSRSLGRGSSGRKSVEGLLRFA